MENPIWKRAVITSAISGAELEKDAFGLEEVGSIRCYDAAGKAIAEVHYILLILQLTDGHPELQEFKILLLIWVSLFAPAPSRRLEIQRKYEKFSTPKKLILPNEIAGLVKSGKSLSPDWVKFPLTRRRNLCDNTAVL